MGAGYEYSFLSSSSSEIAATYFLHPRVAYFGSREQREQAVVRLHRIHEDLNAALARWLAEQENWTRRAEPR